MHAYNVLSVPVPTPVPDSMVLVTDKFWGPSGAESVIGSVHLWLAEAINTLQDNRDTLTAKVRAGGRRGHGGASQMRTPADPMVFPQVIQGCGNPKVNPQSSGPEDQQRRGKLVLQERPPTGSLEKLVRGVPWGLWEGGEQGTPRSDCHPAGLRGQGAAPRCPGLLDQPPGDAVQREAGHEQRQR